MDPTSIFDVGHSLSDIAPSNQPSMRHLAVSFALLFGAGIAAAQNPALIGYWHNWNDAGVPYIELDQVDSRYNVIEISFAEPLGDTWCGERLYDL